MADGDALGRNGRVFRAARVVASLGALFLLLGCERRPAAPERPREGMPAIDAAVPLSPPASAAGEPVDRRIAEELKKADPILQYQRVPIPEKENAFPLWLQAGEESVRLRDADSDGVLSGELTAALYEGSAGFPAGKAGQGLADWLERNHETMALVDSGIARAQCQFPVIKGLDADTSYLATLRDLAQMKVLRAMMRASKVDYDGAAEDLLGTVRFAELMASGEGALLHYLVAVTTGGMSFRNIRWLARQKGVPASVLERLLSGLNLPAEPGRDFRRAVQVEHTAFFAPSVVVLKEKAEEELSEVRAKGLPEEELTERFLENVVSESLVEVVRIASAYHRSLAVSAEGAWKDREGNISSDIKERVEAARRQYEAAAKKLLALTSEQLRFSNPAVKKAFAATFVDNFSGHILGLMLPAWEAALERCFRHRADHGATRTIVALRLYELRHDELPAILEALIDDGILEGSPTDPFSGDAFRYSYERRIIWSLGPDEKNDGGEGDPECWWAGKDLVWRIPRHPLVFLESEE